MTGKVLIKEATRWYPGRQIKGVVQTASGTGILESVDGPLRLHEGDWVVETVAGNLHRMTNDEFVSYPENR